MQHYWCDGYGFLSDYGLAEGDPVGGIVYALVEH